MRKEVKLGMTLGGGLVALLVAYLLVAPPNNKKGANLAGGAGAGNGSIIDNAQPGDLSAGNTDDKSAAAPAKPAGQQEYAAKQGNDPLAAKPEEKRPAGDQWNVLKTGKPVKPTETATAAQPAKDREAAKPASTEKRPAAETAVAHGTPAPTAERSQLHFNANEAWGGGVSTDGVLFKDSTGGKSAKSAVAATVKPTPAEAPKAGGTHVVQSGDSFSSIAAAAYGSASYFPHLIRANPTVNPNNLKLGAVITIPTIDKSSPVPADSAAAIGSAAIVESVKIDPTKQYRVQSGDSLYKISLKIYGKSTYVEKLYEANKAAIGPNATKLKLGMILELPEKAPALASGATDATGPGTESEPK